MDWVQQHKKLSFYSLLVGLVLFIAIIGPLITPHPVFDSDLTKAFLKPSSTHWLGTDKLGRDIFSRILYGAQVSLSMGLSLVVLVSMVGTTIGMLAGFFGGRLEMLLMRLTDVMLSFPSIILAIAMAGIMGGSIWHSILALVIVNWAKYARLVRSAVIKLRHQDYVVMAELNGAKKGTILWRHILPNLLPLVVVTAAMDIGTMMMEIAGLSFLGFGAQPPTPEWGAMLNEGRQYMLQAPELMMYPGVAIFIVVTIFNLWGDALRDVLDPRSKMK